MNITKEDWPAMIKGAAFGAIAGVLLLSGAAWNMCRVADAVALCAPPAATSCPLN